MVEKPEITRRLEEKTGVQCRGDESLHGYLNRIGDELDLADEDVYHLHRLVRKLLLFSVESLSEADRTTLKGIVARLEEAAAPREAAGDASGDGGAGREPDDGTDRDAQSPDGAGAAPSEAESEESSAEPSAVSAASGGGAASARSDGGVQASGRATATAGSRRRRTSTPPWHAQRYIDGRRRLADLSPHLGLGAVIVGLGLAVVGWGQFAGSEVLPYGAALPPMLPEVALAHAGLGIALSLLGVVTMLGGDRRLAWTAAAGFLLCVAAVSVFAMPAPLAGDALAFPYFGTVGPALREAVAAALYGGGVLVTTFAAGAAFGRRTGRPATAVAEP